MNEIAEKAIELYEQDFGGLGCIGDYSCECFACRLRSFAVDKEREQESIKHVFVSEMLMVRDSLKPIVEGNILRQHCVGGKEAYGATRGYRKTMLKDAREIAKSAVAIINRSVAEFEEQTNAE